MLIWMREAIRLQMSLNTDGQLSELAGYWSETSIDRVAHSSRRTLMAREPATSDSDATSA